MLSTNFVVKGRHATPIVVAAIALLCGCAREEIRSYRVPKEQSEEMMAGAAQERPHLHYETPSGWQETQPSSMQAASFIIKSDAGEARLGVTPLPGATGIEVDSVNMWRSELQLPPMTAEDFAKQTEPVKIGEAEGKLVEFTSAAGSTNSSPRQTLGAIATINGALWFFKLTGDQPVVAENKAKLKAFLSSVDVHTESHDSGAGRETGSASSSGPVLPELEVPGTWHAKEPGQMVLAAYNVSSAGGAAEVTITSFPGDVGGLAGNINRWQGQVGLGPIDPADIPKVSKTIGEGAKQFTLVELAGKNPRTSKEARLVAAIVKVGGNSWFYKMLGDAATVEAEKENLIKFVQSAKYPNAG